MSVFDYTAAIKITFDRPIITEVELPNGFEEYKPYGGVPAYSARYSSATAYTAFDGITNGGWSSGSAYYHWVTKDFGASVPVYKMRFLTRSTYGPNAFKLQGSDNNTDWTDVYTGNFANSDSWQAFTFTQATFRYWRIYMTSGYYGNYCYVYEVEFYAQRQKYDVPAGWVVSASEPNKQPDGQNAAVTYDVKKLTKADDNYSIIIWLKLADRIKNPVGDVTVAFTGSMFGPGNAAVAPFSLSFSPTALMARLFNPHDVERMTLTPSITVARTQIYYSNYKIGQDEAMTLTPALTLVRKNTSDIPE